MLCMLRRGGVVPRRGGVVAVRQQVLLRVYVMRTLLVAEETAHTCTMFANEHLTSRRLFLDHGAHRSARAPRSRRSDEPSVSTHSSISWI